MVDDSHRGDVFTEYVCMCHHGYTGVHCETSEYLGEAALMGEARSSPGHMLASFPALRFPLVDQGEDRASVLASVVLD